MKEIPDILADSIDSRSKCLYMNTLKSRKKLKRIIIVPIKTNDASLYKRNTYNNEESKRLPLLETLFMKYPDIPMNIDIKINDDELIQKVIKLFLISQLIDKSCMNKCITRFMS